VSNVILAGSWSLHGTIEHWDHQGAGTTIEPVLQAVTAVKLNQNEKWPLTLDFTKNNA